MSSEVDRKNAKSTRKPPTKAAKNTSFSNATFLNITLSKEQDLECKKREFTPDSAWKTLSDWVDDGYKITISEDRYHDCYSASAIPVGDDHQNSGRILSGKGKSPLTAFKKLSYIHFEILDGVWPDAVRRNDLELLE